MAKWGSFTYDSGQLYGSEAVLTDTFTWVVNVDWDGNGSLDGTNEGQYLIDCHIKRGREEYLNTSGSGFEHMRAGTATLTFDNSTNRYDPRNAAGPLYGNLKPGRKLEIGVHANAEDYSYTLFTGIIDDIVPVGYAETVLIKCVDYLQWLSDQELTFDAELFNTTISGALEHLLTQAQYPGGRTISTAAAIDNQPIWVFAVNKENAASVAHQIADAGLGTFYVNRYGNAVYKRRNHSTSATNMTEASFLKNIQVSQPWDGVYNDITVTRLRYVKQQASVIFTLAEPVFISDGNDETIEVNYDPSTDVQLRRISANTRFDGEGTDLTFTVTDEDLGFTGGYVTIANNSGSDGYVTEIKIRGRKYLDSEQKYTAEDATSQGEYGIRRFQLNSPFLQDGNYADAFADILVAFLKDDRESLILKLRGYPTYLQYDKDVGGLINLTCATLGITAQKYTILGIDHDWMNDNGQDVLTTWYCHKVLVNADSITSSSPETAPKVPPAPDGYDDPGGDPDNVDPPIEDTPSDSALTGLDHIYTLNTSFSSSGQLSFGDFLDWSQPVYVSDDISLEDVWKTASPSRLYLTLPGWYEVTVSGYLAHSSGVSSTVRFYVDLYDYTEGGSGGFFQTITKFRRNSFSASEYDPIAGSYTFPRIVGGDTITYLRIKLEDLFPTPAATFFTNSRLINLTVTVKRIRRQQEAPS